MARCFPIGALAILIALAGFSGPAGSTDGPTPAVAVKLDRRSLAPAPDYAMPRRGGTVSPARIAAEGWQHCALSFDDGPNEITPRILAILDRERVTATYFPIAATAARHPEVIRDFVASGHEIGNHSFAHRNLMKLSPAAQHADLAEANRILRGLGATPVLFRPPYASYNGQLVDTARSLGLETVLWSLDVRDWEVRDAGMLAARVSAGAGPALVVLMHATYEWTERALPHIIAALRDHGCRFVTLSQWLAFMQAAPRAPAPAATPTQVAAILPPLAVTPDAPAGRPVEEPVPAAVEPPTPVLAAVEIPLVAPPPPLFSAPPSEPVVAALAVPAIEPPQPAIIPARPPAAQAAKPAAKPVERVVAVLSPHPVALTLRPATLAPGRGGKTVFRIEGDDVHLEIGPDADPAALAAKIQAVLERPAR